MATTSTDLYRSVFGNNFKKIKVGIYPGDGILDPRWQQSKQWNARLNEERVIPADVRVVRGDEGPEVQPNGGTSLHDVSGWFPTREFWIPAGTEYDNASIAIRKDDKKKTSPSNPGVSGYHYQLEPTRQMPVMTFKGALDNMARAAVARQCELIKTGK